MCGSLSVPDKTKYKIPDYAKMEDYIRLDIKSRRIYEDDDFIIDILKDENGLPIVRISVFDEHGHFLDEEKIYKKDFLD